MAHRVPSIPIPLPSSSYNGIGLVGADLRDELTYDFRDVTFPFLPCRDSFAYDGESGRGEPQRIPGRARDRATGEDYDPLNVFERNMIFREDESSEYYDYEKDKPDWREIVQLQVNKGGALHSRAGSGEATRVPGPRRRWVLGGGRVPQLPQSMTASTTMATTIWPIPTVSRRDQIDNNGNYMDFLLRSDIDDDGDGGAEIDGDVDEGIDEPDEWHRRRALPLGLSLG